MVRLGLKALVDQVVRLVDQVGGAKPGRKVLTLVASILAGGSYRSRRSPAGRGHQRVLPFRVMAPSTLGTFLRSFTFGHIRQLATVIAETIRRAWRLGAGPGTAPMTIDLDSTICEVHGKAKQGAAYGYTRILGHHPLLATWAVTGEVLHSRLRKGSSQRGGKRFVEELIARVRRAGAIGPLVVRADSGFWSNAVIDTLTRLGVAWSITVAISPRIRAAIEAIEESAWEWIVYPDGGQAQVAETTYVAGSRGDRRSLRLVVRRTQLTDPTQLALWPDWRHHAFLTNLACRPSPSTGSTAITPLSSSPSGTSKKGPGSSTARRAGSSPTPPGWAARCSPTTSCAGRPVLVISIPTTSSPWPAPSAHVSSPSPAGS